MGVLEYAVLGLGTGAILALLGLGIVVIFRGAGVVNLAQGSYAMLAAYLCWQVRAHGASEPLSIAVAISATSVLGLLTDQILLRRLRTASPLARLIATAAMLLLIQSAVSIVWGVIAKPVGPILPQGAIHLNGASLPVDRLWLLALAGLLTAVIALLWRRTRLGWIAEAVSESQRLASSQGWSTELVSGLTWMVGTGLAAVAGIFVAPITQLDTTTMPSLVVPALAAALIGQFRSFGYMLGGAVLIGVLQSEVGQYVHITGAPDVLPFLVIIALMVIAGTSLPLRGHVADKLPRVGRGTIRWKALIPAIAVMFLILNLVTSQDWLTALTSSFAVATILLSLVVVIGYTGQVSLAQLTLAGAGALIASRLAAFSGVPFIFALLAGGAGGAVLGFLVALPALRTRGINLTIITLALALAAQSMVFNGSLAGPLNGINLPEITLLGLNINPVTDPQGYAMTALGVLVLCALFTAWLRRTSIARTLLAVRGNERASAASGISVTAGKLIGFAIGGGIAGLGGVMLAFASPVATFGSYDPITGLNYLVEAVIGGVGFIGGALFGSTLSPASLGSLIALHWQSADLYIPLIGAVLLLFTLVTNPDGWAHTIVAVLRRAIPFMRQDRTPARDAAEVGEMEPTKAGPAQTGLQFDGISVTYGGIRAVDDVSIHVSPGQIVGLIGPNGAGKTSLMDGITGFTEIAAGRVMLNGMDLSREPAYRRSRKGISRSFQNLELYADMTVAEHVQTAADGHRARELFRSLFARHQSLPTSVVRILSDFELWEHRNLLPDELPYGRRRLLGVARAMAAAGSVLLIDEPVAGLDDQESVEFARVIRRLARERGVGILVIEHTMPFVMGLCDEIHLIDFGKPVIDGTPEQVRNSPAAIAAYLGEDPAEAAHANEASLLTLDEG
jgi:ABC-type branched-subunit amino acid transport system ATPase component/branched-subunit amino acid ABC-type transport system permease component